jgi:hypothetical protein
MTLEVGTYPADAQHTVVKPYLPLVLPYTKSKNKEPCGDTAQHPASDAYQRAMGLIRVADPILQPCRHS